MVATKVEREVCNPAEIQIAEITNLMELMAVVFQYKFLEGLNLEPGSKSFITRNKLVYMVDDFVEKYPGKSGDVIIDFDVGICAFKIVKP